MAKDINTKNEGKEDSKKVSSFNCVSCQSVYIGTIPERCKCGGTLVQGDDFNTVGGKISSKGSINIIV